MAAIIQNHSESHRSNRGGRSHTSGIKNYGVWKGTPTNFDAQTLQEDRSPHIYLTFDDGSGKEKKAAINVASTDSDSRLVYWVHRTWDHPITQTLADLGNGFVLAKEANANLSLDFIRTTPKLLDLSDGRVLPNSEEGPDNDILDELEPILTDAIQSQASIYIFGSSFGTGIHDVHMNQGSQPRYDNGVGCDGALIFQFPEDGHFEAVFLAFASQAVPTNNETGAAEPNSTELKDIAKGVSDNGTGNGTSS